MSEPLLRAADLTFGYARSHPVVENWSLSVQAGQMVAVTGPSGRGKSTLLYLIGLMLRPHGGHVAIDGVAVSALADAGRAWVRASTFGFVFQDAALDLSRTVLDNVTETALYRGEPLRDARRAGRELLVDLGVDVPAERRPGQVSGGQAQRIALCRALLGAPRVILADEPTGNLDGETADHVLDVLATRADQGAAVILVTHDPRAAARCDETVAL